MDYKSEIVKKIHEMAKYYSAHQVFRDWIEVYALSIANACEPEGRKINVLGKGNKERTVYLNAQARLTLDEYIQSNNTTMNPYIFPSTRYINSKEHIGNSAIEGFCRRLGERVGVRNVHPHRFRRTCATMALKRGMPVEQVSKMLGHEELTTTQIYLDLDERNLEIAHEKYVV
jgi:hypothetical protein